MGYNSVIFICNDAMGEIDNDPAEWWRRTKQVLFSKGYRKQIGADEDGTYGFGNHVNGFQAVTCEHADNTYLIAAGQNYATVIGAQYFGNQGHHTTDLQIKLLKQVLKDLQKKKKQEETK